MAALKTDHIVTTADGTVCRVTYVGKKYDASAGGYSTDDYATLIALDDRSIGNEMQLPVAELTRITDPRNKKPPIEGMPEERPRCQWCDKPLDPMTSQVFNHNQNGLAPWVLKRTFSYWKGYEHDPQQTYVVNGKTRYVPLFHSLGCALKFAGASWRGGYRRKQ